MKTIIVEGTVYDSVTDTYNINGRTYSMQVVHNALNEFNRSQIKLHRKYPWMPRYSGGKKV